MRLIFLGTGGSAPTPERHTTGLYLPDYGILLDAGTNVYALRSLHAGGPLNVLMSHYHLDHSAGLFFLMAGLFERDALVDIHVWGPEWQDRFLAASGHDSALWPIELPYVFQVAPRQFKIGDVEVTTKLVPHGPPVIGYRLQFPDGQSLAYVTDTTAPDDYLDLIQGVDILVHECSFLREERELAELTRHSDAENVGRIAAAAGVGQLYLTHCGPTTDRIKLLDQVREYFPNADLPVEGVEYPRAVSADPRRAIFPGSFDPVTVSHLDIIHTCVEMFTTVHVVVARNPSKDADALFEPQERAELIRRCVPPGVTVEVWEGLTVDYARRVQAGRMVRGLGRAEDYTIEVRLWKTNAVLEPEVKTVWVPPRAEHLDVSSSMVKEAGLFGGWERVKHLVPEQIRDEVGARIERQRGAGG